MCLQVIFRSYFFAGFFFFPLVFLGTILASNLILSIFYLNLCPSQNQHTRGYSVHLSVQCVYCCWGKVLSQIQTQSECAYEGAALTQRLN
jgi:hypothetical protein